MEEELDEAVLDDLVSEEDVAEGFVDLVEPADCGVEHVFAFGDVEGVCVVEVFALGAVLFGG